MPKRKYYLVIPVLFDYAFRLAENRGVRLFKHALLIKSIFRKCGHGNTRDVTAGVIMASYMVSAKCQE